MDELTPTQWIARCAERLHDRWATVDQAQLEEAAVVVWSDVRLRALPPEEAAAEWLAPITTPMQ